ncbi:MAG: MFS transporter [Halobacteriota archaeon]
MNNNSNFAKITQNGTSFIIIILGFIAVMVMFTESMLIPALPTLQSEFNTTETWIAWVLTIYLVVGTIATPIFGKLGDAFGKKKFLLVCMTLYTFGVTANGFAWNLQSLLGFRALQGLGMAMFPLAYAIIRDELPPEKVAMSTGIVSAMFGVGTAVGLVLGAWITDNFGWRMTYHSIIPVAVVVTLLAAYKLKESPILTPSKVDIVGATAFSVAILSFLVAMTEGERWGWMSQNTLGLLGVALIFIVLFVAIEMRVKDPMINLAVLSKRNVFFANMTALIAGLSMFMMFQSITYLLRLPAPVGFNASIFETGLLQVPGAILLLVVGPIAGIVVNKRGAKLPLVLGVVVLAVSFAYFYAFNSTKLEIVLGLVVMMVGMGLMMVSMINIIIQSVSQAQTGIATAMNTVFRTIGGVIGPTIAGVYLMRYKSPIMIPTPRGLITGPLLPNHTAFDYIFLTALGISLAGIVLTLFIKQAGPEVAHPDTQLPKQRPGVDATPNRVTASTAATASDVNNSPSVSEEDLVDQLPSPPPAKVHRYGIEFMVRGGDRTRGANDVTILSANGHVTQLKAERSGEGDDQIQEITFTASDSNSGEVRGAVAVRSADGGHFIRFTPDKLRDYSIELLVKNGLTERDADAVTVTAVDADITQLKAERSGEGDDQIQEIAFTASDSNSGEVRGAVALRSAVTKKYALNISMMYEVRSIRQREANSP